MVLLKPKGKENKIILNCYQGIARRNGRWESLKGVNILAEDPSGQRRVLLDTNLLDPELAELIRRDWLRRYGPGGSNWLHEVHGASL